MARHTARMTDTARRLGVAGLLALVVAFGPRPALGQVQKVEYTREKRFSIPWVAEGAVQRLKQVELYYSSDQGQTWRHVESVHPNNRAFQFPAEREGVYWFTVRTVDIDGRGTPPTLEGQPPQIVVCVDTTPPVVQLSPLPPQDGPGVEWDVRDDNLDLSTLRLEYRGPGSSAWQPLEIQAAARGRRTWQAGAGVVEELRLQVQDKARNVGEAHVSATGRRIDTRPYPAGSPAPGGPASPRVTLVNSPRISINYKVEDVGASGVTLELWWTRDQGRTWEKVQDQLPAKPPCVVPAPGEGVYGFTLVARSGVNLGDRPPQAGEPPQIWVEVDLKQPQVRLTSVEVGRGPDANKMTIRWSAADKNLDAQPVKLEYAVEKAGPWQEIIANQPADGQHVWVVPTDGVRYYVRAVARDRAGNVGAAETPQPVVVDLSRPRGIILDIGPVRGDAPGGLSSDPGNSITLPRTGGGGP